MEEMGDDEGGQTFGRGPPMGKSLLFCIRGLLMVAGSESLDLDHLYLFLKNLNTKV